MPAHNVKPVTHWSCSKNATCAIEFRTATFVVSDLGSQIALSISGAAITRALCGNTFGGFSEKGLPPSSIDLSPTLKHLGNIAYFVECVAALPPLFPTEHWRA